MNCKNCGNIFEGKYCNNCGQSAGVQRFTMKRALEEFFHTFTHVDSGILFLIKQLFIRPGDVAREYIEGKRKMYFNPFQYLVLAVAASTFLTIWFGIIPVRDIPADVNATQKYYILFSNFVSKYFNIILFVTVPLTAVFTRLVYFKAGYNYSENVILNTFIAAQRTLIYILIMPLVYIFKDSWYVAVIIYSFYVVYASWVYIQFFKDKIWLGIIRTVFIFMLSWGATQAILIFVFRTFFYKG